MFFYRLGKMGVGIALIVASLWFCGCGSSGDNPVASPLATVPTGTNGSAQLSFRIVIPPNWKAPSPEILSDDIASPTSSATVSIQLILFNMASLATTTLIQTVEVVNSQAIATFASLPEWPTIAKVVIHGGSYKGVGSLTGCLDLIQGPNVMTLSPAGSNATTSVAAFVMEEIGKDSQYLALVPTKFAAAVNSILEGLDPSSIDLYTIAFNTFAEAIGTSDLAAKSGILEAGGINLLMNTVTDAALANVSDYSNLAALPIPSIRRGIALPTQPPIIPSGNPTLATTTVLGTEPDTATINWYVYVPLTNPTLSWAEWKTTIAKSAMTLFTSYWQMSQPVNKTSTSQTRGFVGSGWISGNQLTIYTIGTGTLQTTGILSASGTQVANVIVQGTPTTASYSFDLTRASDGSASGTIILEEGGNITFSRTPPNALAIGTTEMYARTTGTIHAKTPVTRTLTFTSTLYGNNTLTVNVTTSGAAPEITTSLSYNADGSGTGSVQVVGKSISMAWDMTGAATATVTLGMISKTVSTTVVPRPVDEVPPK
ncbi:MAG: hypothetical protein WA705_30905 [Candidatus Ozemobacteraceae bacterium]